MAITDTAHDKTVITRFFGLSTDAKPESAMVDATFYETDTLHEFVYDGVAWVRDKRITTEQALLAAGPAAQELDIAIRADQGIVSLLEEILVQLQIQNVHLSLLTDEVLDAIDIPAEVR